MNIQIRIQVPADPARSYNVDTDVQVITDPVTVRAVLATILACEAADSVGSLPVTVVNVTSEALDGSD